MATGSATGGLFQMEFRTGVPDRFDSIQRGVGFRIEFRQLVPGSDGCPSRMGAVGSRRSDGRARWNRMQVFTST